MCEVVCLCLLTNGCSLPPLNLQTQTGRECQSLIHESTCITFDCGAVCLIIWLAASAWQRVVFFPKVRLLTQWPAADTFTPPRHIQIDYPNSNKWKILCFSCSAGSCLNAPLYDQLHSSVQTKLLPTGKPISQYVVQFLEVISLTGHHCRWIVVYLVAKWSAPPLYTKNILVYFLNLH